LGLLASEEEGWRFLKLVSDFGIMTAYNLPLSSQHHENGFIIGIDATNLRQGGGRTHLIELLRAATPQQNGITKVIVWGGSATLELIDEKPWLEKVSTSLLNGGLLARVFWQRFFLSKAARLANCNLLFVPGGSYYGDFKPVVAISQNLLPFEWRELKRYGWSRLALKLLLLRFVQGHTFRRAESTIFLSHYAKESVQAITGILKGVSAIIPHGLNDRFCIQPRPQKSIDAYSTTSPFHLLYVSIIDQYKHQWHVVEAVAKLRQATGWPLQLELVGPAYAPALKRLQTSLRRYDPDGEWIKYCGAIPYDQMSAMYQNSDAAVFASSCENMPNILLESMAAGLPIACSKMGPMPEILHDAGVYFDPESPDSISACLLELIDSPDLRQILAQDGFELSKTYSWQRCSIETFGHLAKIARDYLNKPPN
jgi:glycosyltransferase involved in cell wall biosynthesis